MKAYSLLAAAFLIASALSAKAEDGRASFLCHDTPVISAIGKTIGDPRVTDEDRLPVALAAIVAGECIYTPIPIAFTKVEATKDDAGPTEEVWKVKLDGSDLDWYVLHASTGA